MNRARFEEIRKKYRDAKRKESNQGMWNKHNNIGVSTSLLQSLLTK